MPSNILPAFGLVTSCVMEIHFTHWSHIFVVVGLSYIWNLSLIIWALPWNAHKSYPYLGANVYAMFESDRYGISIQNWRKLGKKRINENKVLDNADTKSFRFFAAIYTLNTWILFAAKFVMFLSFKRSLYGAWDKDGFTDFFNIEIALVTLLLIANIFFLFPVLPSFQIAATKSWFVLCCLYLIYTELIFTAILLCIQYPLLISVLYIGASIVLTGMILGMAILCLIALVTLTGCVVFWFFNIITLLQFTQTVHLRAFSASFTWLCITFLVWTGGVCLAFLFTTSDFRVILCVDITTSDMYQFLPFLFIVISTGISIISLFILRFGFDSNKADGHEYQQIETEPV